MRRSGFLLLLSAVFLLCGCGAGNSSGYEIRFDGEVEGITVMVRQGDQILESDENDPMLYHLEAGDYLYDFACEGYITETDHALHVEKDTTIVLEPLKVPEPQLITKPHYP